MDRLSRQYQLEGAKLGFDLRVFNELETNMASKLGHSGAVVLFTGKVSHEARIQVLATAKARDIPLLQCHSCGVSSLRECLECFARSQTAAVAKGMASPPVDSQEAIA